MRERITAIVDFRFYLLMQSQLAKPGAQSQFGPFDTREQAIEYMQGLTVEVYSENVEMGEGDTHVYFKHFQKGSPLEWMQPFTPDQYHAPNENGHGIHEAIGRIEQIEVRTPL